MERRSHGTVNRPVVDQQHDPTDDATRPDGLLRLLGPGIDPHRLDADLRAHAEIVTLLARLWDAPIPALDPVPPFSPDWDDE